MFPHQPHDRHDRHARYAPGIPKVVSDLIRLSVPSAMFDSLNISTLTLGLIVKKLREMMKPG